jgi:hypothetical protein
MAHTANKVLVITRRARVTGQSRRLGFGQQQMIEDGHEFVCPDFSVRSFLTKQQIGWPGIPIARRVAGETHHSYSTALGIEAIREKIDPDPDPDPDCYDSSV